MYGRMKRKAWASTSVSFLRQIWSSSIFMERKESEMLRIQSHSDLKS